MANHWLSFFRSDSDYKRCVAATMITCVYAMGEGRREDIFTQNVKLWSCPNFTLHEGLVDEVYGTIYGAVFKWDERVGGSWPLEAPKIVVAFRGTVLKCESLVRDIILDCKILSNSLEKRSRFRGAYEAVKSCVERYGADKVWIAGHSLGAAIGLLVGRELAEADGHYLQAHLFNPPFVSGAMECIESEEFKSALHLIRDLATAWVANRLHDGSTLSIYDEAFSRLGPWLPTLYVNPSDHICSGYIGYFANQERLRWVGADRIADLAAQHSFRKMASGKKETAVVHLIPSATLKVNRTPTQGLKKSYEIQQWCAPNMNIECTDYRLLDGAGYPPLNSHFLPGAGGDLVIGPVKLARRVRRFF